MAGRTGWKGPGRDAMCALLTIWAVGVLTALIILAVVGALLGNGLLIGVAVGLFGVAGLGLVFTAFAYYFGSLSMESGIDAAKKCARNAR